MSTPAADQENTYVCVVKDCNEKFESKKQREHHIDNVHNGVVVCSLENCGVTLRSTAVYGHVRDIHQKKGVKISCTICRRVISKKNFNDHQERCRNRGKKSYQCWVRGCSSSFAVRRDFLTHFRKIHRDLIRPTDAEKKFPCLFAGCYQQFVTSIDRSYHVRRVHQPIIKCPREGCYSVFQRRYLSNHIKYFHERLQRKCRYCHQDFLFTNSKRHEKRCKLKQSAKATPEETPAEEILN